jgi:hypothetical protein
LAFDALTSLPTVLTELSISDTSENALISDLIVKASAAIQRSLGVPWLLASNSGNPLTRYLNGNNHGALVLPCRPICCPIYAGNTISGSAVVSGLASTTNLFINQCVSGPGIPSGSFVTAVGSGQVTMNQPATATANGVSLGFSLAVWQDRYGYSGAGANAFGPTTQLFEGVDYQLDHNEVDWSSSTGILRRINGYWHGGWSTPGGLLSALSTPGLGNIKVQAVVGFTTLPADLELACVRCVARVRNSKWYGQMLTSESYQGQSYALEAAESTIRLGILSADVAPLLAPFRSRLVSQGS